MLFAQRKVELSDDFLQTLNNNHLLPLVDLIPVPREKHVGDVGAEVDLQKCVEFNFKLVFRFNLVV